MENNAFSASVLHLDAAAETERIVETIRAQVLGTLRRRGAVVGVSGGVDSSVVAALCARAFGQGRVLGLFMPERDCSDDSLRLGRSLTDAIGIQTVLEDLTESLESLGCYRRQEEAIREIVPAYGPGYKCKLVLPSILASERLNVTRLTVQDPSGERTTVRLTAQAYLQLVAATNYKQRVRKMTEYYHADRLNYAVVGTPNRLEYDQGFFVKNGDGAGDIKPIAHLYKSQVYALAAELGVPAEVRGRAPTTDTYSLTQGQDEFYFALPYREMDLCLYGKNHGVDPGEVARATGLREEQVAWVYADIDKKRSTTRYLHARPLLVEDPLAGTPGHGD